MNEGEAKERRGRRGGEREERRDGTGGRRGGREGGRGNSAGAWGQKPVCLHGNDRIKIHVPKVLEERENDIYIYSNIYIYIYICCQLSIILSLIL